MLIALNSEMDSSLTLFSSSVLFLSLFCHFFCNSLSTFSFSHCGQRERERETTHLHSSHPHLFTFQFPYPLFKPTRNFNPKISIYSSLSSFLVAYCKREFPEKKPLQLLGFFLPYHGHHGHDMIIFISLCIMHVHAFDPITTAMNISSLHLSFTITTLITLLHLLLPLSSVSCFTKPHPALTSRGLLFEEKSRLGSTPPSCHNKCNQCHPCMAVQVPTLPGHVEPVRSGLTRTANNPMRVFFDPSPQGNGNKYSNYKPLGWKCRCGDHFFNP